MDSKWGDTPRDSRPSGQRAAADNFPIGQKSPSIVWHFYLVQAASGGMPTSYMHESRQQACRVQMERQA